MKKLKKKFWIIPGNLARCGFVVSNSKNWGEMIALIQRATIDFFLLWEAPVILLKVFRRKSRISQNEQNNFLKQ